MGQFDGNTGRFTSPCHFQIDQLLGKFALHGAKEFLVFLDRRVVTHDFRHRHRFAVMAISSEADVAVMTGAASTELSSR